MPERLIQEQARNFNANRQRRFPDLGASGGITHIGIIVDKKSPQSGPYLIVHNIGQGPQMEDVLFNWKIIGHYRYAGEDSRQ